MPNFGYSLNLAENLAVFRINTGWLLTLDRLISARQLVVNKFELNLKYEAKVYGVYSNKTWPFLSERKIYFFVSPKGLWKST